MTRVSMLAMESGNVFNLQDFEQNEIPLKQRSFEDPFNTFLSLFDTDLLMIWMNNFRHAFRFHSASCPVLHIVLIISRRKCSTFYPGLPCSVLLDPILVFMDHNVCLILPSLASPIFAFTGLSSLFSSVL